MEEGWGRGVIIRARVVFVDHASAVSLTPYTGSVEGRRVSFVVVQQDRGGKPASRFRRKNKKWKKKTRYHRAQAFVSLYMSHDVCTKSYGAAFRA